MQSFLRKIKDLLAGLAVPQQRPVPVLVPVPVPVPVRRRFPRRWEQRTRSAHPALCYQL